MQQYIVAKLDFLPQQLSRINIGEGLGYERIESGTVQFLWNDCDVNLVEHSLFNLELIYLIINWNIKVNLILLKYSRIYWYQVL